MFLFKKKKKVEPEQHFSEYHKCPICGEIVKTNPNLETEYKEKYLDGQRKIPLSTQLSFINECSKCGYLYYYNEEIFNKEKDSGDIALTNKLKERVYSVEYQKIRTHEINKEYKKILQIEYLKELVNVNQLWLDYYIENKNEEKVQEYLLKRIEEVSYGIILSWEAYPSELIFSTNSIIHIGENEVLTDLYRRSGQFEKAKKCINYALNTYDFSTETHSLKKYYEYQLKLVESKDKRHI
jgi:hypothetical protein